MPPESKWTKPEEYSLVIFYRKEEILFRLTGINNLVIKETSLLITRDNPIINRFYCHLRFFQYKSTFLTAQVPSCINEGLYLITIT